MDAPRVSFVERSAGDAAPCHWRVERIVHPDLTVWVSVSDDHEGELLTGVSLGSRDSLEARARRCGARLVGDEQRRPRSRAATQLLEYLEGERERFDLRVLAPAHSSEFERRAWAALTRIPFGQTRSYAEQARMLQSPGAARAVGRANARNGVAIVIPCHRVIGSDGTLTGFAGGLALKRWLLAHEGVRLSREAGPRPVPRDQLALF
jgi:methylated-DNA-[protein]-cysteine S-methyltransferase